MRLPNNSQSLYLDRMRRGEFHGKKGGLVCCEIMEDVDKIRYAIEASQFQGIRQSQRSARMVGQFGLFALSKSGKEASLGKRDSQPRNGKEVRR